VLHLRLKLNDSSVRVDDKTEHSLLTWGWWGQKYKHQNEKHRERMASNAFMLVYREGALHSGCSWMVTNKHPSSTHLVFFHSFQPTMMDVDVYSATHPVLYWQLQLSDIVITEQEYQVKISPECYKFLLTSTDHFHFESCRMPDGSTQIHSVCHIPLASASKNYAYDLHDMRTIWWAVLLWLN